MRALAGGQVVFDVAAGGTASVAWRITLPNRDELAGELATLRVRGVGPSTCLPGMDLPIRLVAGKVVEFAANSRVERQYLYQADHSGSSESLRFGSEFGYLFDVGAARSARLRINVGANGGQHWTVLVSTNDRDYRKERESRSWPSWQAISLDKYLAASGPHPTLYVRIQGVDCQVCEVTLETKG